MLSSTYTRKKQTVFLYQFSTLISHLVSKFERKPSFHPKNYILNTKIQIPRIEWRNPGSEIKLQRWLWTWIWNLNKYFFDLNFNTFRFQKVIFKVKIGFHPNFKIKFEFSPFPASIFHFYFPFWFFFLRGENLKLYTLVSSTKW